MTKCNTREEAEALFKAYDDAELLYTSSAFLPETVKEQRAVNLINAREKLINALITPNSVKSGDHLRIAREFLLWKVPRGDSLTWGSGEDARLTVRQVEELSTLIAEILAPRRTRGLRWEVLQEGEKVCIQDDDFKHDARLYINGDFGDMEERMTYAKLVAGMLNTHNDPPWKKL